jgi:hypothetical protein
MIMPVDKLAELFIKSGSDTCAVLDAELERRGADVNGGVSRRRVSTSSMMGLSTIRPPYFKACCGDGDV